MNERRAPLNGVSKDTYVESHSDSKLNAQLTYDLFTGLRNDLCRKIDGVSCQFKECNDIFIRKSHPRIPLSWPGLLGLIGGIGVLIGLGAVNWEKILPIISKFL